jgi:hypothetical protein
MSNNKDKKQVERYQGNIDVWNRMKDIPKDIKIITEIESIYTCLQSMNKGKLKKAEKIELIMIPLGKYTNDNHMIKHYSYTGKKIPVLIQLDKHDIKRFLKKRYSSNEVFKENNYNHYNYCKRIFLESIYDKVIEKVYSKYNYDMHNKVSWYTMSKEQYIFACKRNRNKKNCTTLTQKQQGETLKKLLAMKVEEIEGLNLESYLIQLSMKFIEFEKLYNDRNRMI